MWPSECASLWTFLLRTITVCTATQMAFESLVQKGDMAARLRMVCWLPSSLDYDLCTWLLCCTIYCVCIGLLFTFHQNFLLASLGNSGGHREHETIWESNTVLLYSQIVLSPPRFISVPHGSSFSKKLLSRYLNCVSDKFKKLTFF